MRLDVVDRRHAVPLCGTGAPADPESARRTGSRGRLRRLYLLEIAHPKTTAMGAYLLLLYGLVNYALFLAAFLDAIGFVGNVFLP